MRIETIHSQNEEVKRLIAKSDAYMASLYPSESNHLEPLEALGRANVFFIGAYSGRDLVATGAVKTVEDDGIYGEVKRVFVIDQYRGKGISREIMAQLERHLVERGIMLVRLETGIRQPEALGLYKRLGYVERPPFGAYKDDPLSVFMEKTLHA